MRRRAWVANPELRDGDLTAVLARWRARDPRSAIETAESYERLADRLLDLGAPLVAFDVCREGLRHHPSSLRLRQFEALALARTGAAEAARRRLLALRERGHADEETIGMLARTYKDQWQRASDPLSRRDGLRHARALYEEAYASTGGYWSGINVATLALFDGDPARARRIAGEVRERCHALLADPPRRADYWLLATLGESALLLGDVAAALRDYADAWRVAEGDFGNVSSTRRQALMIARQCGLDVGPIEQVLPLPVVVVFSGHMVDRPGRRVPRFPAELEESARERLAAQLGGRGPIIAYASAACGADIVFLELVGAAGGTTFVVLPYDREEFAEDSVTVVDTGQWGLRYARVLETAARVIVLSRHRLQQGDVAYDYANDVLTGLSQLHADQLGTRLVPMAFWDGGPGDGPGGTAAIVARWRAHGLDVVTVAPEAPRPAAAAEHGGPAAPDAAATAPYAHMRVMALLFADVIKFSHLSEAQIPRFADSLLTMVADLAALVSDPPVAKNTWGDSFFFVFADVCSAAHFALELRDRIDVEDWTRHGLPADLGLRIALHAGPVYERVDPVTGHRTYLGTHVNHAARIEPITPAGEVYTSEAFAALLRFAGDARFFCEYVGETPLAKDVGTFPTYHLTSGRARDEEPR
jgi:class 3 adenylate cyclase